MTRLATRLQTADARGRRRVHLQSGRATMCSSAAGAARTLCGLDALRLPSVALVRCRARGLQAPLPARPTDCRRRVAQEAHPLGEQPAP